MKTTTVILLTIATLAAAAPNPNADINAGMLSARQGCSYACVCQTPGAGEGPSPDTTTCCTGGTLVNKGTVCFTCSTPNEPHHPVWPSLAALARAQMQGSTPG